MRSMIGRAMGQGRVAPGMAAGGPPADFDGVVAALRRLVDHSAHQADRIDDMGTQIDAQSRALEGQSVRLAALVRARREQSETMEALAGRIELLEERAGAAEREAVALAAANRRLIRLLKNMPSLAKPKPKPPASAVEKEAPPVLEPALELAEPSIAPPSINAANAEIASGREDEVEPPAPSLEPLEDTTEVVATTRVEMSEDAAEPVQPVKAWKPVPISSAAELKARAEALLRDPSGRPGPGRDPAAIGRALRAMVAQLPARDAEALGIQQAPEAAEPLPAPQFDLAQTAGAS
ncbi:MAG: hypothetical protein AAGG47_20945 [Pseudomonadota bacterium]